MMTLQMTHTTLVDSRGNRGVDRAVTYHRRRELRAARGLRRGVHARLGILYHLQAMGAQRGDKMIIFLNNNEQFLDGFWAAVCGGIVPVPLAVGISDEHRHKLLRVARKLGKPYLYTDSKNLERLGAFAAEVGETELFEDSKSRCFLVESITDISRPGQAASAGPGRSGLHSVLLRLDQRAEGRDADPRQSDRQYPGRDRRRQVQPQDVSLSWMPLTHDMGLIGFYLMQFANRVHINLMPTELFVRRPLLWLQIASKKRVTITCSPNFGYRHFLKVLGDRRLEDVDLSSIRPSTTAPNPSRCRCAMSS
jgi:acyl-CoA synthetase (AMP-forming)/AMP-acid ligase II